MLEYVIRLRMFHVWNNRIDFHCKLVKTNDLSWRCDRCCRAVFLHSSPPPPKTCYMYCSLPPPGLLYSSFSPIVRFIPYVFGSDFIEIIKRNPTRIKINVCTPPGCIHIYLCIPLYSLGFVLPFCYLSRQCLKLNIRIM